MTDYRPGVPRAHSRRFGTALTAVWVAVAVAATVGTFALLYAASTHAFVPDSDGATVILEGYAMTHGHLLLSGWAISLDSFWTVDALWNAAAVVVYGVHPLLLHAVPAAIATAVVVIGVAMAVEERRGVAAVAAAGTVFAILALPSQAWANFFIRGPWHVGTALWCLVAFYAVRKGRFGWGFAVAVVFLAAGLLGDLQMLALGVAPVFAAGVTAMARKREWRAGLPLMVAAVASVVLAEVVRKIAHAIGTFGIAGANPIASRAQMIHNIKHGIHEGALLMGVGQAYYGLGAVPEKLSYVHLVAVALVFLALAGATVALIWGVLRGPESVVGESSEAAWRLDDMLVFAAFASFVAFVVLASAPDPTYARYLTGGIIFGTILAGRLVGRFVQNLRWKSVGIVAGVVGFAAASCFAAGVALNLDQPAPIAGTTTLANWLEAHHLHHGVGAYWDASIVTVESNDKVVVRPVVSPPGDPKLVRYLRNSAGYWYNEPFHFVVFDLAAPWGGVSSQTATNTFGQPEHSYTVNGMYEVMVWKKVLVLPNRVNTAAHKS